MGLDAGDTIYGSMLLKPLLKCQLWHTTCNTLHTYHLQSIIQTNADAMFYMIGHNVKLNCRLNVPAFKG